MIQLQESILFLRASLDDLETELSTRDLTAAGLEDFKATLDRVRTTVLAALAADDPARFQKYIQRFHLQRATQVCQSVLFGMVDGTVSAETPGMDRLRSTVTEILVRVDSQGD